MVGQFLVNLGQKKAALRRLENRVLGFMILVLYPDRRTRVGGFVFDGVKDTLAIGAFLVLSGQKSVVRR